MVPERVVRFALVTLPLLAGCRSAASGAAPTTATVAAAVPITEASVARQLSTLAHDSMEGRRTATAGERRAARFIAAEMERIGLEAAGDSGYLQRVTLTALVGQNGAVRLRLGLPDSAGNLPTGEPREAFNVLGAIPGSDPVLRDEVVIVGAHFDHLGIGRAVEGDSIYNGADDDASGVVATLGIAAALRAGPAPRRTVLFAAFTGEEMGLLGTRWYIARPTYPIERTVANLQVEMIGRPDSLAGGPGKGWLTGYERSTMGDMLKASGSPIVPDPRPSQNFFMRSDNIAFARLGIPAHTLSSFNLHQDYHRPSDEANAADIPHMTAVIRAAADMVRQLADGPRPEWHPGGRP
ncbi:MAG TPA: M20/M25/M40 family metallo-hydrolase [Gemmatimonadales bacterium]|nr:M20/M25/M40 family metallo-hydrolase [Gemmatimonadales bacterium]